MLTAACSRSRCIFWNAGSTGSASDRACLNRIALPIILWHPFASGMAISPHRSRSRISSKRGPVAFQIPMPDRCISLARDQDGYRAGHDQPDVRSSRNGFWRNHVCAGPSMPRDVRTADAASLGFDRGFHARSVRAGTNRGKARHRIATSAGSTCVCAVSWIRGHTFLPANGSRNTDQAIHPDNMRIRQVGVSVRLRGQAR